MYRITKNTDKVINTELAEMRLTNKDGALTIRKVYGNLKCKTVETIPTTIEDLVAMYTGTIEEFKVTIASAKLLHWLAFEEIEEVEIPEIEIDDDICRFEAIENIAYEDMTAHQLSLVLFKDLGSEIETQTLSMTTGLKVKLDLLDELKDFIVKARPDTRIEVLENKLANALALVKKHTKESSLAVKDGRLLVYEYLATKETTDIGKLGFLAKIGGDKTKMLDVLILESAFKSYKSEMAHGNLPATSSDLNLAIVRMINGIKPVTEASKQIIDNLDW